MTMSEKVTAVQVGFLEHLQVFYPHSTHVACIEREVLLYRGMKFDEQVSIYKQYDSMLKSLEPLCIDWLENDAEFLAVSKHLSTMKFDQGAPRFFPEWYAERRTEYALTRIMSDSTAIEEFLKGQSEELSSSQQNFLQHLVSKPATWVYANLLTEDSYPLISIRIEDFCDETFQVVHHLNTPDESRLLPFRLLFVFDNGNFIQSSGYQHSFVTLFAEDLQFFFDGLRDSAGIARTQHSSCSDYIPLSVNSITQTIRNCFIEFLTLDSAMLHREVSVGDEYVELIYEEYCITNFTPLKHLPGKWDREKLKGVEVLAFSGPDKSMLEWEAPSYLDVSSEEWRDAYNFPPHAKASLFIDQKKERIAIMATTNTAWHLTLYLLSHLCEQVDPLKIEPDCIVSLPTLAVATQITSFRFPWNEWWNLLPPLGHTVIDEILELSKIRSLMNEVVEAQDFSFRFNEKARCKRLGVDPSLLKELLDVIANSEDSPVDDFPGAFQLTTVEGDYEIHDLPPITQQKRSALEAPISESQLFTIHEWEACPIFYHLTGGAYSDSVDADGFAEHIEDLFYIFFDDLERLPLMMMNYLFLLFWHERERWVPVRTYGVEILKLLYPYLRQLGDDDLDAFITRFSDFVYSRLRSRALVDVLERPTADQRFWGTYVIKPTQLFTTLIKKK